MLPSFPPSTLKPLASSQLRQWLADLALISSGVGGASEVFEDNKSGLKFEAGNAESLAEQIKTII